LVPLSVVVSLVLRVVHRGAYYPGLDVVAAASGLHRISTVDPREILRLIRDYRYDGMWDVYGFIPTTVPGWLAWLWPSEYWPHVVTFATVAVSLWLVARALEMRRQDLWVVLLAWSASPASLSFSVAGFAYASCILPHGLALWIVLRLRQRWLVTALLCVLAVETGFQVQELGRTVFLVFFAAAFLLPRAPWRTRGVWLVAGGWSLWLALHHQDGNTARFSGMVVPAMVDVVPRLGALWRRTIELKIDLPILPLAALAGLALMPARQRWFWAALVAIHFTLVVLIGVNEGILLGPEAVWSRRTLLFSFMCLATAVAAWRARPRTAWLIVGLLLVGSVWQLADTVRWSRRPLNPGDDSDFTLPFVTSSLDYDVQFLPVRWYLEMRDRVDSGMRVLVLYNLSAYDENATNPAGVLDRLYLHLGHQRFVDSVLVFGLQKQRLGVLPIRSVSAIGATLRKVDLTRLVGYGLEHPGDAEASAQASQFRDEMTAELGALTDGFQVDVDPHQERDAAGRRLTRFTLRPR
jgi:hypothetical protein